MSDKSGDLNLPPQGVSELSGGGWTVREEGTDGRDQVTPDTDNVGTVQEEGDFLGFAPRDRGPVDHNVAHGNMGLGGESGNSTSVNPILGHGSAGDSSMTWLHGPLDQFLQEQRNTSSGNINIDNIANAHGTVNPLGHSNIAESFRIPRDDSSLSYYPRREERMGEGGTGTQTENVSINASSVNTGQTGVIKTKRQLKRQRQYVNKKQKSIEKGMHNLRVDSEGTSAQEGTPGGTSKRDRSMLTPEDRKERKAPRLEAENAQTTDSAAAGPLYSQVVSTVSARIMARNAEALSDEDRRVVRDGIVSSLARTSGPHVGISNLTLTMAGYLHVALKKDSSIERLRKIVDKLKNGTTSYKLIGPDELPPMRRYVLWVPAEMLPSPRQLIHMLIQCNGEQLFRTLHVRGWKENGRNVAGYWRKTSFTFFLDIEPALEQYLQKSGGKVVVGCGSYLVRPYHDRSDTEEGMVDPSEAGEEQDEERELNN